MIVGRESRQPQLSLWLARQRAAILDVSPAPGPGLRKLILKILRQIILKMTQEPSPCGKTIISDNVLYWICKRGKTTGTQVQHILTLNAEMAETCHRFDVMGRNYC